MSAADPRNIKTRSEDIVPKRRKGEGGLVRGLFPDEKIRV